MITIDMEKPEKCVDCPMHKCMRRPVSYFYLCGILGKDVGSPYSKAPVWCPIKEISNADDKQ